MLDYWIKDMKLLWRDRTELIVILLMPFVLIIILGFALKGVMGVNGVSVEMTVGLVDQDEATVGMEQFQKDVTSMSLPQEIIQTAEELAPKQILIELLEENLTEIITLENMTAEEADKAMINGDIDVIVTIPKSFTYHTLTNMFLDQPNSGSLQITKGEHAQFEGDIFQTIMEQFTENMNLESAIGKVTLSKPSDVQIDNISREETVTDREPITAMEYYAMGMAVMFAFFVAATLTSKAYNEMHQQVIDRLILSGKPPIYYLLGKMLAIVTMVIIQVVLLFSVASFILQLFKPYDWAITTNMLIITIIYALSIGAIGSLLVSLTMRFQIKEISDAFANGIVMILSLVGGSFLPVNGLPTFLQTIGSWTPNGLTLKAFMLANQGIPLSGLMPYLSKVIVITIIIFILGIMIFPQRRMQS